MTNNVTTVENDVIGKYINEYEQKLLDIKNKSVDYLNNNNDLDLLNISVILKSLRNNQIVFPKKIRKQNLLAKSKKTINDLNSLQLTPLDFKTNNISIQNKTKKFNQKVVKLTTGIEKNIILISSIRDDNKYDIALKKISRLQKNIEKLQIILDILSNSKEQVKNKNFNQYKNTIDITNELGKVHKVLEDINTNKNAIKILKQGDSKHHLVNLTNKIKQNLHDKQKRFMDICIRLSEAKNLA